MEPKTVMVVDDEPSVLAALVPLLASSEVVVEGVRTAAEAERRLETRRFDLVIADLRLGGTLGTEGLELISLVKRTSPTTQVALLTAYRTPEVHREALRRGAVAVWSKSLAAPLVIAAVRALGIPAGRAGWA
jgi:DNA-binding NtrC family response regulator